MAKHGRLPNKCDPQTQSKVGGHDWLCTVTLFLNTNETHTQHSRSTLYSHWLPPTKKLIVGTANKPDCSGQHTATKNALQRSNTTAVPEPSLHTPRHHHGANQSKRLSLFLVRVDIPFRPRRQLNMSDVFVQPLCIL